MKKNLFFILAIALGLGLMACNQSAEPAPEEWPCDEPHCQYESTGTDLWPSLRTDATIRNRLVGKWQQIAWSSKGDEEMHYEESESTIEFAVNGDLLQTSQFVRYHIDRAYLYRTVIIDKEPVINNNVFWYAYQFSDNGNEFTIILLKGNTHARMNYPVNFIYKRMN
jgi:hypothetical protein